MVHLSDDGGSEEAAIETTSLLSSHTEAQDKRIRASKSQSSRQSRCSWPWVSVVALCITLAVTVDIGEYLFLAPKVRLFESIACTGYYLREDPSVVVGGGSDGSVPEYLCKVDQVQDRVAMVLGWQLFFDSIPAILLPVPYGYLADTYGRKWITLLSMVGYALSWAFTLFVVGVLHLPLQYVWLSSLFSLIGGGPTIGTTLMTTIVADVVPPEKRSSVFFFRFASDLIAEFFVPPVTSILMAKSPWIPLLTALGFQVLAVVVIMLVLPETLPIEVSDDGLQEPGGVKSIITRSDRGVDVEAAEEERLLAAEGGYDDEKRPNWLRQVRDSFGFVARDPTVAALLFTFLVSKVGRQSINILLQYVSKRYGWSLSKAGLLLSLRAAVNLVLYMAVLPSIAALVLSKATSNPASKDLWIARASIILLFLGTVFLSVSATPALMIIGLIIFTLGTGFAPATRSLLTSLVESPHQYSSSSTAKTDNVVGRLYALIAVLEGVGSLIAGPGMAWAFRCGINLGRKGWLGLPFAVAAGIFALVSGVVYWVRV